MKSNRKVEWFSIALIILAFIVTGLVYSRLPDPMPTHWNVEGEPDGYSSRLVGAWLMPVMMLGLYLLLLLVPHIDPRRENLRRFAPTFALIRAGLTLFFGYLHVGILYAVLTGRDTLVGTLVPVGVGALFILIGNYMPRFRPNWFVGIRTPWTLSSDQVWRSTHRLGGRLFILSGLVMFLSPILPEAWRVPAIMVVVFGSVAILLVYSFLLYQQESDAASLQ